MATEDHPLEIEVVGFLHGLLDGAGVPIPRGILAAAAAGIRDLVEQDYELRVKAPADGQASTITIED